MQTGAALRLLLKKATLLVATTILLKMAWFVLDDASGFPAVMAAVRVVETMD